MIQNIYVKFAGQAVAICDGCGHAELHRCAHQDGKPVEAQINRRLIGQGWRVSRRRHLCTTCHHEDRR